jgi:hypothetical protein
MIEPENGLIARVIRAALLTRDMYLDNAERSRFDDETFHACQAAACGWQAFADHLLGAKADLTPTLAAAKPSATTSEAHVGSAQLTRDA